MLGLEFFMSVQVFTYTHNCFNLFIEAQLNRELTVASDGHMFADHSHEFLDLLQRYSLFDFALFETR